MAKKKPKPRNAGASKSNGKKQFVKQVKGVDKNAGTQLVKASDAWSLDRDPNNIDTLAAQASSMFDDLLTAVYRKDIQMLGKLLPSADIIGVDADGRTLLMYACLDSNADAKIIKCLISKGANVNATDGDRHWTALHFAARDQKTELVKTLVSLGAGVDAKDKFGMTPLWECVMSRSPSLAIVRTLLKKGANPRVKNVYGEALISWAKEFTSAEAFKLLEKQ